MFSDHVNSLTILYTYTCIPLYNSHFLSDCIEMQGYITRQSCVLVAHASGEGHQLRISLCCPDPGGQEAKMTDAEMRW